MENKNITKAIIASAVIIALALVIVQLNKSNSIEKQLEQKIAQEQLTLKREECLGMLKGLQNQWGNIIGVKYEKPYDFSTEAECLVTYTDSKTGLVDTAPLRFLMDAE